MKKFSLILIMVTLALSFNLFTGAMAVDDARSTHLFFHTGSPLLLEGDQISSLDPLNPDVAATVINSRTVLPLRAFAEYFGAVVSYDAVNRVAIIEHGGSRYLFPIDKQSYSVDTKGAIREFTMDTSSTILNSRTMVPLRVLAEDVFQKSVSYFNRVIAVGETQIDLASHGTLMQEVQSKIGVALKAQNFAEVQESVTGSYNYFYMRDDVLKVDGVWAPIPTPAPQEGVPVAEAGDSSENASGDYSTTNTQVEGIDEADLVKTDGKYLYIVAQNAVRIVSVNQGDLTELTTLRIDEQKSVQEIFVDGDRLVILGSRNEYDNGVGIEKPMLAEPEAEIAPDEKMMMPPYRPMQSFTFVDVYDITDVQAPSLIKTHEMEGAYSTSRKNGDIVYLVSNTQIYGEIYVPTVRDTATGFAAKAVELSDVMLMPRYPSQGFVGVSAIDIRNDDKAEVEVIAASGAVTYMNDHALYLAATDYNGKTAITKFTVSGLQVGYAGSGEVPGYLVNQFAMDEYQNHLRVATTNWGSDNSLYVLDSSMNIAGSVTGLAKGENIYSVRFVGAKGYIVTFRTVDPLFVFDLSDPTKPVVTGELKIPGFSNYLHPVSETHLLGLGMDVVEIYQKDQFGKEVVIGTKTNGIKVSLFDVSDMGKPVEVSKYLLGNAGSYAEALSNHKAIMFDPSNSQFGFDAYLTADPVTYTQEQGAVIMSYANNELALKTFLVSKQPQIYGTDVPSVSRVVYVGDVLYYIQGSKITSYDYANFKEIDSLVLLPQ